MADQTPSLTPPPEGYAYWLADLKSEIYAAQQRAAFAVNQELVHLYWQIGHRLHEQLQKQGGAPR
ncbi:hypothetical protein GCM10027079_29440 [Sediminivirga luteola]|uniref:YhcG N-terminal domain-containing protein n=1 Tax=Sediminivirga luteola TaxID=1774748 RepID=A0A8J2TZE3_9MICO|nr:hypothetical protein GCM10011333_24570 [Sediminivirga luteola]